MRCSPLLLFAVAFGASLLACGNDDVVCDDSGALVRDVNATTTLATDAAADGSASTELGPFTVPTRGSAMLQRFAFAPPCDGLLTTTVTIDGAGEAPAASWEPRIAFADSSVPLDVVADDPDRSVAVQGPTELEVTMADGPYVLFVPPGDGRCVAYRVAMTMACTLPDPEICDDDVDNDNDGDTDCDDADCAEADACNAPECPETLEDALEPNDRISEAYQVSLQDDAEAVGYAQWSARDLRLRASDETGRLTADEDWYEFSICAGGRVNVVVGSAESSQRDTYVVELQYPNGGSESAAFTPDGLENDRRYIYRAESGEDGDLQVRVRHPEPACTTYDIDIGLTCGTCFGFDALDGEDLYEPNEGCTAAGDLDTLELPIDASIRNAWPTDPDDLESFGLDDDWFQAVVCGGGSGTFDLTVPEGPAPDYELVAMWLDPAGNCFTLDEDNPDDTSGVVSGTSSVTFDNPSDEAQILFVRLRSEALGACMRYEMNYAQACP